MRLEGFVFTRTSASAPHICNVRCEQEIACQSYNYNRKEKICELNNRAKEARPEGLRLDPAWFSTQRLNGRGMPSIEREIFRGTIFIFYHFIAHLGHISYKHPLRLRVFRGDHMVFRVNEGGDQSSLTDGKRGTIENYGGGDGGDHKNIKILKNLSEDQVTRSRVEFLEKFHLLSHYILNDFVLFCLFHAACSFNFEDGIGG
ncbi:unnamed protein product [Pocillopora meandrina]|uniref:Apple domain-containing protein n=1 Tax=Pocillopora meandrina TaxID=46732 RepID=A0AAU9X2P3_9CNID|nr:unnamed protein product [Pocillopora meandrina]